MKRWWLIILLLLSLGINVGFLARQALRSGPPGSQPQISAEDDERQMRGLPPVFRRLADELQLQGEERERFLELQRELLRQTFVGRQEVSRLQKELRRELVSRQPDRERIDHQLEALARAHFQLEKIFVDHLLDTREMLEPRQERLFMRFMSRLREARRETHRWQQQWQQQRRSRARKPEERQLPPSSGPEEEP